MVNGAEQLVIRIPSECQVNATSCQSNIDVPIIT